MKKRTFYIFLFFLVTLLNSNSASAQTDPRKYRIASIEIYPQYQQQYLNALTEHTKIAVKIEQGVLALQALYDQKNPAKITVFEVYANEEAYQSHLKTPHFLKYKTTTLKMVKSLQLSDVAPIAISIKGTNEI